MDTENRRKCQYCRFQACLGAGMRINWVLSDQERNRRFNKLIKVKSISIQKIPSTIHLSCTLEEEKNMESLHLKFKFPWLQNCLMFNKEAGVNFIEHVFGCDKLRLESWDNFKQSMGNSFIRCILPRFQELTELSSHDVGQIMNSSASGIAKFFRGSQVYKLAESGHVASHVSWVLSDQKHN